jgi:hypothetical protein
MTQNKINPAITVPKKTTVIIPLKTKVKMTSLRLALRIHPLVCIFEESSNFNAYKCQTLHTCQLLKPHNNS